MSSTSASPVGTTTSDRLEVLFEELAELAGQRNAIDGRIVEIAAQIDRALADRIVEKLRGHPTA